MPQGQAQVAGLLDWEYPRLPQCPGQAQLPPEVTGSCEIPRARSQSTNLPVQQRAPLSLPPGLLRPRPEVSSERRREANSVQERVRPPSPPGQARTSEVSGERRRRANSPCPSATVSDPGRARRQWRGAQRSNLPVQQRAPRSTSESQARSQRREAQGKQTACPAARHSATAAGLDPKSLIRGVEKQTQLQSVSPVATEFDPGPGPKSAAKAQRSSPSISAPLRQRFRTRPEVSGERCREAVSPSKRHHSATGPGPKSAARGAEKQSPRPAARPSGIASGPGPKSLARGVENKSPRTAARPSATGSVQGPEFSGNRRSNLPGRLAARPLATASGPGPKSAPRGAEKQTPRQA